MGYVHIYLMIGWKVNRKQLLTWLRNHYDRDLGISARNYEILDISNQYTPKGWIIVNINSDLYNLDNSYDEDNFYLTVDSNYFSPNKCQRVCNLNTPLSVISELSNIENIKAKTDYEEAVKLAKSLGIIDEISLISAVDIM